MPVVKGFFCLTPGLHHVLNYFYYFTIIFSVRGLRVPRHTNVTLSNRFPCAQFPGSFPLNPFTSPPLPLRLPYAALQPAHLLAHSLAHVFSKPLLRD